MAVSLLEVVLTIVFFTRGEARICTRGFLSTVNDCTGCGFREDNGNVFTRIIPDMNFTCNGTVTYWRAAGGFETGGNRNSVLSIWRERSNEPGTYDRIGRIKLGRCGGERQAQLVMGMNNVYECTLPQSEWVTYQHGDIVGIELFTASDVRFRLYFNSIGGSRNYIFTGKSSHPNNVELNNHEDTETQDLPQISLTKQPPSTSRMDGDSNSGGGGDTGSQTGTIAGVVICIIVAILLASVIIFLLVFVLRRRKGLKKFTPPVTQSNRATTNPVYDGNVAVQVPESNTGPTRVHSGVNDRAQRDYEDVDGPSATNRNHTYVPLPTNLRSNNYSRTTNPHDANGYAVPFQTLAKDLSLPAHYEIDTLYVPTQEQRKSLPANGEIYATIKKAQQSESGPAPVLFKEDETYWEPAKDTCGLIRQLSSKKYREIVRPQIRIVGHLGGGQFGTVSKGIWQSPMGTLDVAVKQLQPGASEEEKVKFLQEAAINGQFRHPNVIKLMGVVTIGEPAMIVLELLTNSDLRKYLLNLRPLLGEILPSNMLQLLLNFCQQVASGMDHLARKSFVHRDLAARNILVTEDRICKISDFGMSRDIMNETYYISRGGQVPVKWTAPEAINFKKYSTASDVWSFGCVMYEVWSLGQKPFEDYRNIEVVRMIDEGYRLPPPPGLPKELYKIMIQCWHPDRSSRPTFFQIVEMLSRADFELFVWEEEDLRNSDPQVKMIGAPLEVAKDLYLELQRSYINS